MPTHMPSFLRRHRLLLALVGLVFLAGLFLRAGAVVDSTVVKPVRGDAISYFFYAVNLTEEGVYSRDMPRFFGGQAVAPDADINPGFPLFVYALLDDTWRNGTEQGIFRSIDPVIRAQTLLASFAVLVVFLIGRRLAGNGVGLAAAALTAISPHLVNINIYLLTEPLFIIVFWLALLALARATREPDPRHWLVLGGLVLGLAAMVRPTVQYLPLLLAGAMVIASPQAWRRSLFLLGGFAIVMAAWSARNLASVGATSDPLLMIATIQVGSYPGFMYEGNPDSLGVPYLFDPVLRDFSSMARTLDVLGQRVMAAPGEYLHWYLVGKPLMLLGWETMPIGSDRPAHLLTSGDIYLYPTTVTPYAGQPLFVATYLLSKILHVPLQVLAVAGAVLAWVPRLRPAWGEGLAVMRLLSLTLAYVIGIHMVGSPFPRYAIPFLPVIYLLALATLAALVRAVRARRAPGAIEPAGGVL